MNINVTDAKLFLDDSIDLFDMEIASNSNQDADIKVLYNHAYVSRKIVHIMFTSTCNISTFTTEEMGLQCVSTEPRSNDSWCNQNCLDMMRNLIIVLLAPMNLRRKTVH
eukprot:Awhi_evm1s7975